MTTTSVEMFRKEPSNIPNDNSESSSCCSSSLDRDDTIIFMDTDMAGVNNSANHSNKGSGTSNMGTEMTSLILWRNFVVAFTVGTGVILSVCAHLCLSNLDNLEEATSGALTEDKLPVLFTTVLASAFGMVALFVFIFTRHAEHLITGDKTDGSAATGKAKSVLTTMMSHRSLHYHDHNDEFLVQSHLHKKNNSMGPDLTCPTEQSLDLTDDETPGAKLSASRAPADVDNLHEFLSNYHREASLMVSNKNSIGGYQSKPIAELFEATTILFADIEGFTAWSSVREPSQVFTLLETLYHDFDVVAQRRKVFKVETVGDCYVAVSGLPEPRKDHALVMARFARDILKRMRPLCKRLEIQLGPETGELNIRIGLNSGPVTGGLLRGHGARFQLFGDAVNTASRIESTGQGGQIHLSHATAELLKSAGKSHWVSKRPTKVLAKGLGVIDTYWLSIRSNGSDAQSSISGFSSEDESEHGNDEVQVDEKGPSAKQVQPGNNISSTKTERLVSWNVDLLHRLLKQIVARRHCLVNANPNRKADADESIYMTREGTLLDEVKESISLPSFNYSRTAAEEAQHIQLDPVVFEQLQDYVRQVAALYTDNPFHNFEHASHVSMSVSKLLSRIVAPSAREFDASMAESGCLHDHTYGITSDPLTQFACVLSALIHDAAHPGVPNTQLLKEQTEEAKKYERSVAEQNSVDRCWNLLMEPRYEALRKTIYTTHAGLERFRSLVVNSVMATDIVDKDLKALRNARWERAFKKSGGSDAEDSKAANDRKATIVIEHLLQASDVAHTMQHWHVYRKWNERLFRECYKAYKEGRAETDPATFWYQGEIGFYDYYIIPLAKKLKECGVFGVSSSEYLDYAVRNREQWELRGRDVVKEMVAKVQSEEQQPLEEQSTEN